VPILVEDVFRVVGAKIPNPPLRGEFLDLVDGVLDAALVDAGLDVEMKEVVAEPRAARPGFHTGEVDIAVGERLRSSNNRPG